jgi:raffinose/stachyose/melibiose transport system permease protein
VNSAIKARNVLRVFFFAPAVITPIVTAFLWRNLLGPDGAVNSLLGALGLSSWQQDWLGDPQLALWSVVGVIVWQFAGYSMVIFLAGLQSIPAEIYEAVNLDGAGAIRRFWSVVRPLLAPAFTINLLLSIIGGIKLFDQVYALTRGRPRPRHRHAVDADLQGRVHARRVRLQHRVGRGAHHHRVRRLHRASTSCWPARAGHVMNRYTWRSARPRVVMVAAALVVGFPVYVLLNLAFRAPSDVASPVAPTTSPTMDNFVEAWRQGALGGALFNSILVTAGSVVIILAVSSLAAYPLARVTARWSRGIFLLIMLGLMLPFQLAALPLYQTMRDLGLLGTPWALILFYSGLQVPFTTFLYVGFLRALPSDFEDAALIDGCTHLEVFRYVVFPMLKPITVTGPRAERRVGLERLLHPAAVPERQRPADHAGGDRRLRRPVRGAVESHLRRARDQHRARCSRSTSPCNAASSTASPEDSRDERRHPAPVRVADRAARATARHRRDAPAAVVEARR